MSDLQDLLDDLNDRLDNATNAEGAGEAKKIRWINNGVRAMWPRIFVDVADTFPVAASTYEYALGAEFDGLAEITRIDGEDTLGRFLVISDWALDTRDTKTISFAGMPVPVGNDIRVQGVRPVPIMATVTDTYEGPDGTEELPVLYAMGIASGRLVDPRLPYTRYSTVNAQNGVDINEIMNASQFWFAQFELLLDRLGMPWPTSGLN